MGNGMGYIYGHISVKVSRPLQLQQMITYHHNIINLMNGGANWRTYDFQYRVDREYQQCPWDTVRVDLERDAYLGIGVARTSNHFFRGNNYKNSP